MAKVTFKLFSGGECRRFTHPAKPAPTVAWLRNKLVGQPGAAAPGLKLTWTDSDGDVITIADEPDLAEAIAAHQGKPVRVTASWGSAGAAEEQQPSSSTPSPPVGTVATHPRNPSPPNQASAETDPTATSSHLRETAAPPEEDATPAPPAPEPAPANTPTSSGEPETEGGAQKRDDQDGDGSSEDDDSIASTLAQAAELLAQDDLSPCQLFRLISVINHQRHARRQRRQQQGRGGTSTPVVHHGIVCDRSGQNPIVGPRFHLIGEDYDLNEAEFYQLPQHHKPAFAVITHPDATPVSVEEYELTRAPVAGETDVDPAAEAERHAGGAKAASAEPEAAHGGDDAATAGDDALPLPDIRLQFGHYGQPVAELQRYLISHGLMSPDAVQYRVGFFGPRTAAAVYAFQLEARLDDAEPGVFDRATRARLLVEHASASTEPTDRDRAETAKARKSVLEQCHEDEEQRAEGCEPEAAAITPEEEEAYSADEPGGDEGDATVASQPRWASELGALAAMGFAATPGTIKLLDRTQGALDVVISALVNPADARFAHLLH